LLSVACQFAASELAQNANNNVMKHCVGNLLGVNIFAARCCSQIVVM
jgi:hypothetical protein